MALITKPDMEFIWASGGAIVEPSDVKKQTGWTPEVPPHQWENWLQNRQDQMLAHINQRGVAAWDALTNYEAGGLSYAQGSDGLVYKSVAASGPSSVVQNPVTDVGDTYWTIAFANTSLATETLAGLLEVATTSEVFIGSDNTRAVTPAGILTGILGSAGLTFNGHATLPVKAGSSRQNLVIQWGTISDTSWVANTFRTLSYPIVFPNEVLQHTAVLSNSAGTMGRVNTNQISTSQLQLAVDYSGAATVRYIAIGY